MHHPKSPHGQHCGGGIVGPVCGGAGIFDAVMLTADIAIMSKAHLRLVMFVLSKKYQNLASACRSSARSAVAVCASGGAAVEAASICEGACGRPNVCLNSSCIKASDGSLSGIGCGFRFLWLRPKPDDVFHIHQSTLRQRIKTAMPFYARINLRMAVQ